ncbi:MAG TPA: hypothetical protein VMY76_11225 [Gemmatimonadales bacterium]|nr:hypothetical protein [Gemmatimonadales bacterium]
MPTFARSLRRPTTRVALAGALMLLAGCAGVTPISELLQNSSKYNGKTVSVRGEVKESAGLLGRGAYQIKDDTGQLTVVSETSAPPPSGSKITAKGVFEALLTIGSKSLAVLREKSRSTN